MHIGQELRIWGEVGISKEHKVNNFKNKNSTAQFVAEVHTIYIQIYCNNKKIWPLSNAYTNNLRNYCYCK